MLSVRATIQPLLSALGSSAPVLLRGLTALPLINQAVTLSPLSVRELLKVIASIPPEDVVNAGKPQPPIGGGGKPPSGGGGNDKPPSGGSPPPAPTCSTEVDESGFGQTYTSVQIFGAGFSPSEKVDVYEDDEASGSTSKEKLTQTTADSLGRYEVTISVATSNPPSQHRVHAEGEGSGRKSAEASYTV